MQTNKTFMLSFLFIMLKIVQANGLNQAALKKNALAGAFNQMAGIFRHSCWHGFFLFAAGFGILWKRL
jgi:hypothetical protein